jgi:mannose/fructose-specific phosphotransferase system component IIA
MSPPDPASPLPALLVTHGTMAEALLEAARRIAGSVDGVDVLSNENLSRDGLIEAVRERVRSFGPAGGLVLADAAGGSCAQASLAAVSRGAPGPVRVVCGVNLPMLLDFLHNRGGLTVEALAERLVAKGRASVVVLVPPGTPT